MQHQPEKRSLPAWQVLALMGLTAVYLTFELAFNARLLDVVGGGASSGEIHRIEVYGRTLSGIALALFVLQGLLVRRANSSPSRPTFAVIALTCAISGGAVYVSIEHFVDWLAHRSSPAFRRASLNIALVQSALVRGGVQLDGLADDPRLFSQPAGKAFLALFPLMSLWVERLDDKIHGAKLTPLQRQVSLQLGGASGFYDQYDKAVSEVMAKWRVYRHVPTEADLKEEISRQQDRPGRTTGRTWPGGTGHPTRCRSTPAGQWSTRCAPACRCLQGGAPTTRPPSRRPWRPRSGARPRRRAARKPSWCVGSGSLRAWSGPPSSPRRASRRSCGSS
jgi:hypothetical protein